MKNKEKTERQHFVPQFLIKNWIKENTKGFYYIDKNLNTIKYCSRLSDDSDVFWEHNYYEKVGTYTRDIEKKLGTLESELGTINKKIITQHIDKKLEKKFSINLTYKEFLKLHFILFFFKYRNTNSLDSKHYANYYQEEVLDEIITMINKKFSIDQIDEILFKKQINFLKKQKTLDSNLHTKWLELLNILYEDIYVKIKSDSLEQLEKLETSNMHYNKLMNYINEYNIAILNIAEDIPTTFILGDCFQTKIFDINEDLEAVNSIVYTFFPISPKYGFILIKKNLKNLEIVSNYNLKLQEILKSVNNKINAQNKKNKFENNVIRTYVVTLKEKPIINYINLQTWAISNKYLVCNKNTKLEDMFNIIKDIYRSDIHKIIYEKIKPNVLDIF